MLDPKIWWPLFPLLLLLVIVCLTWALVGVVRWRDKTPAIWFQLAAFTSYIAAAVAAIASERGSAAVSLHRPFSIMAQLSIAVAIIHYWRAGRIAQIWINGAAWGAILMDTALHYLMAR
jgi:uncharacterized membrane protein YhaH (DUF805 family)